MRVSDWLIELVLCHFVEGIEAENLMYTNEPFYRFPIFQIPASLAILFITLALLSRMFSWFTPTVSIHVALDLSNSTYGDVVNFRQPGTVMMTEIESVKEYARRNANLSSPNLISVSAFANQVVPITNQFSSKPTDIENALDQVIQPSLISRLGGGTNLDAAVENAMGQLLTQVGRCKEVVVVTDGQAVLRSQIRNQALASKIKLNFLLINDQQEVPRNLEEDATKTGGNALVASPENFVTLLSQKVFNRVNKNPFVVIFSGLAWVCLIWALVLPLERFLRRVIKIRPAVASRFVIFNTILWTTATPITLFFLGLLSNLGTC
jgi:Ca-activated chloride channel family protein